jgi:hypothetical protein
MSVWDGLGDPDTMARLRAHPAYTAIANVTESLIAEYRATEGRDGLRPIQERLAQVLVEAEGHYRAQSRLSKLGGGDPIDLLFWRRALVQLRAVGDGIAWRFLGFRRQWIVLMGRNQRPGLMSDKPGFDTEWQLFNEHWDDGEPTVLTGLTNCITLGDLLVARDDVLWTIEVKKNASNFKATQMGRLRQLQRQLNEEPRIDGPGGTSWVLESSVPFTSYWSSAQPHLDRARRDGVAAWVPTSGVGVLFSSLSGGASLPRDAVESALKREQLAAQSAIGDGQHRILAHSFEYPYRPNRAAPLTIYPVSPWAAAAMLTGDLVFTVEVHVEGLVEALQDVGLEARNLLANEQGGGPLPTDIVAWRSPKGRGVVHSGAIEQLAIDLMSPKAWAAAIAQTVPPDKNARAGFYPCLAEEQDVWT